jgi:K+-dependent Na+/Ca+ exchanger-like protein
LTTVLLSLLVIVACVYALSVITDGFFVESLDEISHRMRLPPSVAGASLMAMGSSAPELAIALFALFRGGGEHSDLGIGTIVGSAVFNILVITGVSALARPASVKFRVVLRDSLVYLASVGLLLWVFRDGEIVLWEAGSFIALYAAYLVLLFKWPKTKIEETIEELVEEEAEADGLPHPLFRIMPKVFGLFAGDPKKHYVRAFIVSIVAVGALCWVLVDAGLALAGALGIPPVLVALTILAGGTSVPDMISSIVVARRGEGEMAVANAVGSNIFDILICLGLPWAIAILALGRKVHVGTEGLWSSTMVLLGTVFLLMFFLFTGRRLSRIEGSILLGAYVAYVVWVYVQS